MKLEDTETDYKKEKQAVKKELDTEKWVSTPDLATQTQPKTHKKSYWRNMLLPAILENLDKNGVVKRTQRHEGGHPTYYWRLKK